MLEAPEETLHSDNFDIREPVDGTPLSLEEISAPRDANWDCEWISATATRNYMLRDPLLDWLKYNYSSLVSSRPQYTKSILRAAGRSRNSHSFTEYIMEQGQVFETKVIELMSKKFGSDIVVSIGGELNPRSPDKVKETLDAMNKGVPFIHSGLLHNPENNTYGIPDLIVRSDWLNKLVSISPLSREETHIPAPRLRSPYNPEKVPKYHYLIVDIKFSTLNLRADGIHLLNSGSFPAYKSQLLIYNYALARIQGYNPKKAYVLGRRWKFSVNGIKFNGDSCFDKLGVINYQGCDCMYIERTKKALKWLREVKSPEAESWNIDKLPLTRPELYPNMSNTHDYPWRHVKEKIASSIHELTSLWMVGTKHRSIAHEKGIYEWTDEKCTAESLGIKGGFTSRVLGEIISINQQPEGDNVEFVRPRYISNNLYNWKYPETIEFYVDFETINDVITDFESLPVVKSTALIFMIGVAYVNPVTDQWVYRDFTVKDLTLREERRICTAFSNYIRSEAALYNVDQPLCVHWAPAESNNWERACERHPRFSDAWRSEDWIWFDLLKVFKDEPIIVKGCLKFGLKSIVAALKKHGCIGSSWDKNSSCLDGQDAMVGAWKACKDAKTRQIPMTDTPQIKEIVKYNEVDVRVLREILCYLRENHINPLEKSDEEEMILEEVSNITVVQSSSRYAKRKRSQSATPIYARRRSKRKCVQMRKFTT